MKLKINIVGLTHNDVEQNHIEYARSAGGKLLKLVPDEQNRYDPMAVKVYDGSLFIGYVAAQDLEDVKALMLASGKKVLRACCTGFNTKEDGESGLYLTAVAKARVRGEAEILDGVALASFKHEESVPSCQDAAASSKQDAVASSSSPELEVSGGKIISMSIEGKVLPMPTAMSQAYKDIYADQIFDEWHYSGPDFSIDRLARIDDCTDMLEDSLQELLYQKMESEGNADMLEEDETIALLEEETTDYLADFIRNQRFDYSREMTQMRKHIQTLLELLKNQNPKAQQCPKASFEASLEAQREVLLLEMGYLTSSSYREEAAHIFFIDTPIEELKRKNGNYDYSDRIDEIEQELAAFPYDLYRRFKADPVDFLREIFYKRVPRKMMRQLLSGIIFMIINHRVDDVKRWGKHDDRIALQEMKELRHIKVCQPVMSEEERAERAKMCIRKMAVEPGKTGYGWMIKSQADWYVVQRVLVDAELIDIRGHAPFSEYLAEVMGVGNAAVSDGRGSSGVKESSGMKVRPHIPLCKKKDLDQASVEVFEKTSPKEWAHLSDEELGGVQQAKFNHYCDIVDAMLRLL